MSRDECVLKITIKALQEYEAGITSCSTLGENLKEAEQCPTGDETRTLVNALNSEFTSWCAEGNSSNNNSTSALMPKPSEGQQCLLRIVVALLQDENTNGIESCGSSSNNMNQAKTKELHNVCIYIEGQGRLCCVMAVLAVVLAQDEATDTTQSTEETTLTPSGIFPELPMRRSVCSKQPSNCSKMTWHTPLHASHWRRTLSSQRMPSGSGVSRVDPGCDRHL
uniref:Uncharacterized protein n=1 Tax=Ditylenchus dipsaci TaxID=166011 RepID=A0A915CZ77_9BILA